MTLPQPPLLVISDRKAARRPLDEVAAAAFRAGCRWFSLREKDIDAAAQAVWLSRLAPLARIYGARLTIHGISGDCAAVDGVHLPRDADVAAVRQRLGPKALIGSSAHDGQEAAAAAADGADYVTLSPIFPSSSKPGYGPALGLDALARVAAAVSLPVVALGGVTAARASDCLAAGAAGVAVMSPVMAAEDPERSVVELLAALTP